MKRRIPPDAFEYYFSLGGDRSYQVVADKYGVSKQAITKTGKRERSRARVSQLMDLMLLPIAVQEELLTGVVVTTERELRGRLHCNPPG